VPDYDGDGFVDLMVSRMWSSTFKTYHSLVAALPVIFVASRCNAGHAALKGLGDSLYHNQMETAPFTDVPSRPGG